jgi:23S rRNA (uracil1939-C5)-methyltransferase
MNTLCRHFGTCGGCTFQDMGLADYRALKQAQVLRALERHGLRGVQVELPLVVPPGTRRRAALAAIKNGSVASIGFREARSHAVVDMLECRILTPSLVGLVPRLREILTALLRDGEEARLQITQADNGVDIGLKLKREADAATIGALGRWAGSTHVVRLLVNGEPAVQLCEPMVRLAGVEVCLPPDSFLQPTREGELILQEFVRGAMKGAVAVGDIFSGCGTFAFALAGTTRVHAADSDSAALSALTAAARRTARLKPVTTETRDLFKRPFQARELDRFDGIVLDPPRAGALAQVRALAASKVARIAYVSCNPESFARDARMLVEGRYRIEQVAAVDQFLWSSHIELAALIGRH